MMRRFFRFHCVFIALMAGAFLEGCGSSSPPTPPPPAGPQLIFSTYLGGATPCDPSVGALTFAQNAVVDALGNIYVTGATTACDLPVLNAWQAQPAAGSTMSAFVAKYDGAGNLLWSTYLGGDGQSIGVGVVVMPDGGAAVMGLTTSDAQGPFPTTNAFQDHNNGQSDAFVTVFDSNGAIRYSTYLGGSGVEGTAGPPFADDANNGNSIAVDAQGLVYVTGPTNSGAGNGAVSFPVTANALQRELNQSKDATTAMDAFMAILDPAKSGADSLVYSSFLGGSKDDKGHAIAVDAGGDLITVVGYTQSRDFPTTANAYRPAPAPDGFTSNGFVIQFTSSLPGDPASQYAERYCTYLGADAADARDDAYAVALDPAGLIAVTGRTESADFPMNPQANSIYNSAPYLQPGVTGDQPYLVKIDPSQSGAPSLAYATFLGGDGFCTSAAVNAAGISFVGGETDAEGQQYTPSSTPAQAPQLFPYTADALFTSLQGSWDAILMGVSADGATLSFSTYLGGSASDRTYGLAVDPSGNVIMTGLTFSSDFPLKNPAQSYPGNTGSQNAFVTKIGPF